MQIGDGATCYVGSDCYPYTVVGFSKSGHKILVTQDIGTMVEGSRASEHQVYTFAANPKATTQAAYRRKDGYYNLGGSTLVVGVRRQYLDPCF